jgi:hypothetical protein
MRERKDHSAFEGVYGTGKVAPLHAMNVLGLEAQFH